MASESILTQPAPSAANIVDPIHDFVKDLDVTIVRPPQDDDYAPGYYSVLFEDRDGIRIEVNHVPGKGHLAKRDAA